MTINERIEEGLPWVHHMNSAPGSRGTNLLRPNYTWNGLPVFTPLPTSTHAIELADLLVPDADPISIAMAHPNPIRHGLVRTSAGSFEPDDCLFFGLHITSDAEIFNEFGIQGLPSTFTKADIPDSPSHNDYVQACVWFRLFRLQDGPNFELPEPQNTVYILPATLPQPTFGAGLLWKPSVVRWGTGRTPTGAFPNGTLTNTSGIPLLHTQISDPVRPFSAAHSNWAAAYMSHRIPKRYNPESTTHLDPPAIPSIPLEDTIVTPNEAGCSPFNIDRHLNIARPPLSPMPVPCDWDIANMLSPTANTGYDGVAGDNCAWAHVFADWSSKMLPFGYMLHDDNHPGTILPEGPGNLMLPISVSPMATPLNRQPNPDPINF